MKIKILFLFSLAIGLCRAEPVALTRQQAFELYTALTKIEAGLSPANTIVAADNINALTPAAESYRKGAAKLQREVRAIPGDAKDATARVETLAEAFEAKAEEQLAPAPDLAPLALTADEIREAKISPGILSIIRRWLQPPKK